MMTNSHKTVLFDIDGTLANINHRRPILESDPHNWKDFFAAMGDDTPNLPIVELYQLIQNSQKYDVILVSGRPEQYRSLTEQWLMWNNIQFSKLIMRPQNDQRADYIVKEEILKGLIKEGREVIFVVDDRKSVVDMWRRNGITCLQCDDYDL